MSILSFLWFFVFLTFFVTGFRKNADFLSPARLFGLLWAFIFGLVEFKFSYLQNSWTTFDWLMVLFGLLTFLFGTYISFTINLNKPFLHLSEIKKKLGETFINERNLFRFIIIYFVICTISFTIEWQIMGYIPIFTSDPGKARVIFGVYGLRYISSSFNVVLFLIMMYFIFVKDHTSKKYVLSFIFLISFGNYILFVQRYGFFLILLMGFCVFYYSGRKINAKIVILFIIVLSGFVILIQSLRTTEIAQLIVYYDSKMKFSSDYAVFTIPYMYLSMNVENFVKYFSHIENFRYGLHTFDFISEATTARLLLFDYFNYSKTKFYIGGYNTYPFYWPYYLDFGIAGLAMIPFILGFVFSEIYYSLHRNPTILVLILYSIAFSIILISFSSDPLTRLDSMLPFAVIVLAQVFIIKKPSIE